MSMTNHPRPPEDESSPDPDREPRSDPAASPFDETGADPEGTASRPGAGRSADELLPVVYDELRRIAQRAMARERAGHTLQATALVHEAYARLVGGHDPGWENSAHFFRAAARAMRRILVDHARARGRIKRGGGAGRRELRDEDVLDLSEPDTILDLDEALSHLEGMDPRAAQIVQLRYFGGLTVEETARVVELSPTQVKRESAFALAYLRSDLDTDEGTAPPE